MPVCLFGYALHLVCTVSSVLLNSIFLDEGNPWSMYVHVHGGPSASSWSENPLCVVPTKGTALNPDQQNVDVEGSVGTAHFCVNAAYLAHLCGLLCKCAFYTCKITFCTCTCWGYILSLTTAWTCSTNLRLPSIYQNCWIWWLPKTVSSHEITPHLLQLWNVVSTNSTQ